MDKRFYLMRKNDIVTFLLLDEQGGIAKYSPVDENLDIAPLQYRYQPTWIRDWWNDRSVPIGQGKIKAYLEKRGFNLPSEYLVRNLGLSLTDYFWIKPVDSNLKWEDVNLFDNPFKEHIIHFENEKDDDETGVPHYSPNGSLQGQIEKTWAIMNDNDRVLIKGNRSNLSSESINEIIATEIHKLQGYDNYTPYHLIKILDSEYDFGCYSKLFTDQNNEMVSAYALYTSEKIKNNISPLEHLLEMCEKYGMDRAEVQRNLDYEIMVDFIMSGYDRHLNNIGFIRDAKTLKFKGMAPIFDSGGAFFVDKAKPRSKKDYYKLKTNSFFSDEITLLEHVENRDVLDLSKLPPASVIIDLYMKDSQIDEKYAKSVGTWYEKKIEMCSQFQRGQDLKKQVYGL